MTKIDFNLFKEYDVNLFQEIGSVRRNDDDKFKSELKIEIEFFLDLIIENSREIKYLEDYRWISKTVTFWKRFLESEYSEITNYTILQPKGPLTRSRTDDQTLQIDSDIVSLIEKLKGNFFGENFIPILVKGFPRFKIKILSKLFEIEIKKVRCEDIKVITSKWYSYQKYSSAIKKMNYDLQEINQECGVSSVIFLSDYAFGVKQYSTEKFSGVDTDFCREEFWRDTANLQKCKIPFICFIDISDFDFFENNAQEEHWNIIEADATYPKSFYFINNKQLMQFQESKQPYILV
jgi:hypothetical protein